MPNELAKELCHAMVDDNFLSHHGIKNMHWGVKNGPPYPLDRKVSARIKKGKNEKARYSKKEIEDMRKNPNAKKYKKQKVGLTHLYKKSEALYPDINDFGGLPIRQYQNERGGTTTVSFTKGNADNYANVASIIGRGQGDWIRRLDRPGHKATIGDVRDCNWQRQNVSSYENGRYDPGLNNNCGKCAATMFLRSLGYDVQAGRAAHGVLTSAQQYWFDGAKAYKSKGAVNLYQQMASFGNQGKGTLGIRHKNGSGHAVYFQNERGADGKVRPVIYDGQIGKRYDTVAEFLKAENADMTQFSTVTRLDTATPNWKNLAEDSVCRMNFADEKRNMVSINDKKHRLYGERISADRMSFR